MKPIVRMVDIPIKSWEDNTETSLSLEVSEGEFLLIIGNNGSGKSRLLNFIAGLSLPEVGEVFIKGKRLTTMTDHQRRVWRSGLGLIPSDPILLDDYTIFENLCLTAQILGKTDEEAQRNAHESAVLCGLEPLLKVKCSELSLGLKKRTVIARALVNQPELILADSPLEGLDESAQEEFLYICTKLTQIGYPIVMTSSLALPFEIKALKIFRLPKVK